jgi:hypothetical protein
MRTAKVSFSFSLNETVIESLVPNVLTELKAALRVFSTDPHDANILSMKSPSLRSPVVQTEHVSIFSHRLILDQIKRCVLSLPERRLQTYKNENFVDYVRKKNFRTQQLQRLLKHISKWVDPPYLILRPRFS